MAVNVANLRLAIAEPQATPVAQNFRPQTWPPQRDFPIVIDKDGKIISRYGDPIWDFSLWAKKRMVINFGDGLPRKGKVSITPANADLLRQIAAWWLYGPNAVQQPSTLKGRFNYLRALFVLCSEEGITASNLMRFPLVADKLPSAIIPSMGGVILTILHTLYEQREQLGFTLLDREGLIRFEAALPDHVSRQTPYIPPRIWTYQVQRLRTILDDFLVHREGIEACFRFCIGAYAKNFGSLPGMFGSACVRPNRLPFGVHNRYTGGVSGFEYHGSFEQIAKHFGIAGLLERWCIGSNQSLGVLGIRAFAKYFSLVVAVGTAYLLNFSLMRIIEVCSLRCDCLEIEQDENFGPIYVLRGETTKTVEDDDARWPTSPSVKVAVDALSCISRLRMICADANPDVPFTADEIRNPRLVMRAYEPWVGGVELGQPHSVISTSQSYIEIIDHFPSLFDVQELRITEGDLRIARLVNSTLDGEIFAVGNVWPLAWHQLRRTGAVNMQASGLVSDSSLQYLLKHATRAMSLYYGQGYSKVRLNEKARVAYISAMYEVLGKEVARLFSDRFVSPHGEKRKAEILKLVDPNDSKKLTILAKSGRVSYRETLLGGCTSAEPCVKGCIENVALCGGSEDTKACPSILYDRDKEPAIRQLGRVIASRIDDAPEGSPLRESLEAQKRTVEYVLNAIKK